MEADSDLDQLMAHLGEFGRWQRGQYALQALSALTAGVHMLSLVTVAAVPDHRCLVPGVDDPASPRFYDPAALAHLPLDALGRPRPCLALAPDANATTACPAMDHVFAPEHHAGSLAARWGWVCERRWMGAAAQSAFMFGVFTGAVVLGALADRYGRKPVFCVSAVLQCVLGVAVAFSSEFYAFLALRFLYGVFGSAGAYITGFVLAMEMVGASRRTVCGIAFQGLFAAGVMLVALWGYLIRDATQLQVLYGLHGALLLGHWWLLAESPRWLWAQGRVKEAVDVVAAAVRVNGGPPLDVARFVSRGKAAAASAAAAAGARAHGLPDLVRTPRLRARTLLACLNWFANSLVYYGLSLNTGGLAGDPFLVLFLVGLVELPSYVATVLLLDRTGRRPLVAALMLLGGALCAAAAYLPPGAPATAAVLLGKFFIAGSFAIIYNYSAELFPTVVRNSALGLGSMCARLSGALTPLITLLDTFEPRLPAALFGGVAVASGLLSLLLPETLNKALPQTVEDGEAFGRGDTACAACCRRPRSPSPQPPPSPEPQPPHAQPLASPRHI